ncbi:MarR family winged helix-turn-helix transcriptional regulator [Ferrovibrio sp.]|uniref:MarR family winged helix-turn-helix transcriptional regulator n=1 Tax=Ferrovibrio sp. TaxID=1917215 RepID=UPI0035139186
MRDEAWRRDNIGRLLNDAARAFEAQVLDYLARAGHDGLGATHINVTRNLDSAGTRLTELARRAAMTKQSMGELVRQMEALGYLRRDADPQDGRAQIVRFTAKGAAWLKAFRRALRRAEADMAARLGAGTVLALRQSLQRYRGDVL